MNEQSLYTWYSYCNLVPQANGKSSFVISSKAICRINAMNNLFREVGIPRLNGSGMM